MQVIDSVLIVDPDKSSIRVYKNEPLKNKNWFQTGGQASFFCQPTTIQEFQHALSFGAERNLDIFVLGAGANLLISDDGFDGLVICPHLKAIEQITGDGNTVLIKAGAGVVMDDLITFCLQHNMLGLEEFSGIPGTVGGSVYINIHYFEYLLEQFLVSAEVIHACTGQCKTVDADWFTFGYNSSRLHEKEYYLMNATFVLKKGRLYEAAHAKGRYKEIVRHRNRRYPNGYTCGSFFRNFYPNEVTVDIDGKKMIYVAYYLDKLGIKGQLSVGDAIVSYQHANMIVNSGNATTTDIATLAYIMQQRVKNVFGIIPQPECQLMGFKEYPLL